MASSLMGSLYVGVSGLQTGQNSLNTTAHNLSNAETTGYVRQQALLNDRVYNTIKLGTPTTNSQKIGLGVTYAKVRQVRDYFLDQSYRRESGRSAFYDASYEALTEVEDLLDEYNDDASFQQALTNMWSSIEELAKTPDDTTVQRLFVQNAQTFLNNATQVYQGLVDYQNEVNRHVKEQVEKINDLGKKIDDYNKQIKRVEAGGIETANDLRDARNQALDELSELVDISYKEDIWGSVAVSVEGNPFVTSDLIYEMGLMEDASTGFYTPYWKVNAVTSTNELGITTIDISNAKVFDTTATISSETNTDVGKLRALLYIRGDKVANYTDIPVKPEMPNSADYSTTADYDAAVADYYAKFEKYEKDVKYYNQTINQSVCMNIQSEFDQLVHNVVTTINNILYEGYLAHEGDGSNYMTDDDGSPLQLFIKVKDDGFEQDPGTGEWIYKEEITDDPFRSETLYSIPNLMINPTLVREAGKLGFKLNDGTVDYDTVKKLVEGFDANSYTLNPNVTTKCSINTYYTNLVSQVANSGSVYKNISLSQQATVESITASREQVIGVSSDEELTNMVKFQNAYNAASRYINVVDEMLEHILNTLG